VEYRLSLGDFLALSDIFRTVKMPENGFGIELKIGGVHLGDVVKRLPPANQTSTSIASINGQTAAMGRPLNCRTAWRLPTGSA
jgi:hypothetical protein